MRATDLGPADLSLVVKRQHSQFAHAPGATVSSTQLGCDARTGYSLWLAGGRETAHGLDDEKQWQPLGRMKKWLSSDECCY